MKNPLFAVSGSGEKLGRRSLFLAAPGAGVLLAQTLTAQTPAAAPAAASNFSPTKIGVIDATRALAATKDGQKAQTELDAKLGPKYAELKKLNDDIQDLQKRLDQGGNIMSQASKTDLQNSIQSKTRQLQRGEQDFQDEQQKQQNLVLADLYAKMEEVIKKYATDNGFALILNVGQENTPVLWVSNEVEITQAIVEAYDKAGPITPKANAPAPAKSAVPTQSKPPATPPPARPPAPSTGANPFSPKP